MVFNSFGIKSKNISLMYLSTVIGGMLFFLPIFALYLEQSLFSVTNIAIIFAVEAVAIVLFEVPTGAIADLFGRKRTIVLGHMIVLLALVFLLIGGSMLMFIVFAILNALAMSLNSGTSSALIYDTLKEENKEKYYKKIIGTFYALWPLGASIGAIIGGYLAVISLSFTVLASFIPMVVALFLVLFLREPAYQKEKHRNVFRHISETVSIIKNSRQLLIIVIGMFLIWGLGEATFGLTPLFLVFKEIPIMLFGFIIAGSFALSSLGHYFAHDISNKIGNKLTVILSVSFYPLLLLFATMTAQYFSIMFFIATSLFFGFRNPIIDHMLNQEVDSSKRATILSSSNFMGKLGLATFAPLVGYFADLYTINTAFMLTAIMMFSVPILFLFLKGR